MKNKFLKGLVTSFLLAVSGLANAGIIYVTNGDSSRLAIADTSSGTLIDTITTSRGAYPIAVQDSIWLGHLYGSNTASEYDLNGLSTGSTSTASMFSATDGASDGTMNYALTGVFSSNAQVISANKDWTNQQSMFSISSNSGRLVGITFDSVFDSFWISSAREIFQYSLTGDLISKFSHSAGDGGALAYDQETDSIWMVARGSGYTNGTLVQYNKSGSVLQTQFISGLSSNNWGAEFAMATTEVPEPSTLAVFALGLMGLASRKFKKQA
ncbi:MAG: PEP-CTERM sorting domain-containing protein [Colwellia polaris]|jgi:hypothetical protein